MKLDDGFFFVGGVVCFEHETDESLMNSVPTQSQSSFNNSSSALWIKDSFWLRSALSLEPQYQFAGLRHAEEHLDYKDWQIPLGRRFRALKLWFVLRLYGTQKIHAYLQHQ